MDTEDGNRRYGRLVVMADHVTKQRKAAETGRPKRKYVRREDIGAPPVTQANVMMTQGNFNLLARLLEGKNAPLVIILVLVLSILYGVFVLAQDIRKDVREDMGRLSNNVSSLTEAVKELKPRQQRQQASN